MPCEEFCRIKKRKRKMEKTVTYYKEMAQNVRYGIEKESNILIDRLAQMDEYKEMAECVEELLAEVQVDFQAV